MLVLSSAAAQMINMRQSVQQRRTWQKHAGANVAVCAGPARWCFRISDSGEWCGASPLVAADAEVSWECGKMHIRGDGELLKDLEDMWRHNSPRHIFGEIFGTEAADDAGELLARTAEYMDMRDLPTAFDLAPPPAEVSAFCQQCAALSRRVNAMAARVGAL